MKVMVLAFGITKEIFGSSAVEMELSPETSVTHLKALLEEHYPQLKQLSTYRIAVNNEYASSDDMIRPNDEVAIIPPVSGG